MGRSHYGRLPGQMRFLRRGSCRRCGACCDPATLPARLEAYRQHGALLVITQYPDGCRHFRRENGRATCAIYPHRPKICQLFPLFPVDIAALPTCGFYFVLAPAPLTLPGGRG